METEVNHPSEVDEIFDAISYSKGSCVIRMLHEYLGKDNFRLGLVNYLAKYKYTNAFTEDLWGSLEDQSGEPVTEVMSTWTKLTGYPVVHVIEETKGDEVRINVEQLRFLKSKVVTEQEDNTTWAVPIYVYAANSNGVR